MDFWTRLFGVTYQPRTPVAAKPVVTSQDRLTRFQTALADVERLCSNKRDLAREKSTLAELQKLFEKLAQIIREETRASIPHPCVAWALKKAIFVTVNRAAAVSFHEGCIHAAVALMAALVDSEEDSFLTNTSFAKSLMRLVTRVINAGDVLLSMETETFILELLFTISAKIRLQPEILPSWFTVTSREAPREKSINTKDDFPLCYILVDRIYHDGRIGDFARTGLLYIFEATGKSAALEMWIVESSDVCTLMASGLGALYSQLSRELSILYPDAVLPATLALSDYTTTQPQARAESAFSERHIAHMTTFLSYLAFWQDILDHCKSDEVRQSLLDHFQVLFLQQLLYPSILESSDLDRGSSVAVLSYLTAILESLEHPILTDSIMSFLMAVEDPETTQPYENLESSVELKKRQSLLELSVASGLEGAVEPALFNLVDLLQNSLGSNNAQTLFCALRLTSTIVSRQSYYAFSSMIKVDLASHPPKRSLGSVQLEIEQYTSLARSVHNLGVEHAFARLMDDLQIKVENHAPAMLSNEDQDNEPQHCLVLDEGAFLQRLLKLLDSFFTNSVDVNLALTESIIAVACSSDIRLDGWLSLRPAISESQGKPRPQRDWQRHVDEDEKIALGLTLETLKQPQWPEDNQPILYTILAKLVVELDNVRQTVPNLDMLITGRKNLLQAASIDATIEVPPSMPNSPRALRQSAKSQASDEDIDSPTRRTNPESTLAPDASAAAADEGRASLLKLANVDSTTLSAPTEFHRPPPPDVPATTDVLMKSIEFDSTEEHDIIVPRRIASLNHVLTNTIVLQEFILEIVAVLSVRASVLGEAEVDILLHKDLKA